MPNKTCPYIHLSIHSSTSIMPVMLDCQSKCCICLVLSCTSFRLKWNRVRGLYSTEVNKNVSFMPVTVIEWKGINIMCIYFKQFMIIVIDFNWVYFELFFFSFEHYLQTYSTCKIFIIMRVEFACFLLSQTVCLNPQVIY